MQISNKAQKSIMSCHQWRYYVADETSADFLMNFKKCLISAALNFTTKLSLFTVVTGFNCSFLGVEELLGT